MNKAPLPRKKAAPTGSPRDREKRRLADKDAEPRSSSHPRRSELRRLAHDLAHAGKILAPDPTAHSECEGMLAWYVTDERNGENVRDLYPAVWNHLQTCTRCSQSHELLGLALETEPGADMTPAPRRTATLSFLSDQPFETWRLEKSSSLLGQKPRMGFRLNPAYVQKVSAYFQYAPLRDRGEQSAEHLLLQDDMPLRNQTVTVSAWLVPSTQVPNLAEIRLQVISPGTLPGPLTAYLRWGQNEYATQVTAGRGRFEDIALPDLAQEESSEATREFQLSFEFPQDAAEAD